MSSVASTTSQAPALPAFSYGEHLQEGKLEHNLNILSNLSPIDPNKGVCTERVWSQIPSRYTPDPETIRQWTIGASLAMYSAWSIQSKAVPFILCMITSRKNALAQATQECTQDTRFGGLEQLGWAITHLTSTAFIGLSTYAALRFLLHDKTRSSRFETLRMEYGQACQHLVVQHQKAVQQGDADKVKALKETARKLNANFTLILTTLVTTVRLTLYQATAVTAPLQWAASHILSEHTTAHSK